MDLSKLTPAPWFDDGYRVYGPTGDADKRNGPVLMEYKHCPDVADEDGPFVSLARNAFDVMMRRHWGVHWDDKKFRLDCRDRGFGGYDKNDWQPGNFEEWCQDHGFDDPFTALCAAEEWYVANAEKK